MVICIYTVTTSCKRPVNKGKEKISAKLLKFYSTKFFGGYGGLFDKESGQEEELRINNSEVSDCTQILLGSYVVCFALLTITNFWDIFWINISDVCDDNFDCFISTNETRSMSVSDCSILNDTDSTDTNSLRCYNFPFNYQEALATAGGLATAFKFIPTAVSKLLFKFSKCCCCIEKRNVKVTRLVLALLLLLLFLGGVIVEIVLLTKGIIIVYIFDIIYQGALFLTCLLCILLFHGRLTYHQTNHVELSHTIVLQEETLTASYLASYKHSNISHLLLVDSM